MLVTVFGPLVDRVARAAGRVDGAARVHGDGGGLAADPRPGACGRGRDDAGGCTAPGVSLKKL